jgi:purine-cytosine permease-like protein
MTWFLAYFFVTSVNRGQSDAVRRPKDILFDVCQALAVLSATYGLGFVLPDRGFGFDDGLKAFVLSNVVVALICLASLLLFGRDSGTPQGLHRVRVIGLCLGVAGALVAWRATHGTGVLIVLSTLQCFLWWLWWVYFRIRLDH